MKSRPYLFVASALAWAACLPAQSQYHVDAINGSDTTGDGSSAAPWQTLAQIPVLSLMPGDRVRLARDSVFRERLEISTSGASGQPIVVEAYGTGRDPIISAGELIPAGAAWQGPDVNGEYTLVLGTTTDFYTSDLVAVRSAAGGGIDSYVLIGQPPPATTGLLDPDEAYGDVTAGQRTLRVKPPAGAHPTDFDWEVSRRNFGLRVTSHYVEVANVTVILGNDGHSTWDAPVVTGGMGAVGDFVTFRGCRVAFGRSFGLYLEGSYGRIEDCIGEYNRSTGIVLQTAGAQHCTVEGSTARFNGNIEEKDLDRGGIGVQGDFATVRGNFVFSNGNANDNVGPRVGGDGAIQLFNCKECVVEGNFIVDSVRTAIDMSYDPSSFGHRFVNNVIVNWNLLGENSTLKTMAITGLGYGDTADSARLVIANNTIYSDQSSEWLIGIQVALPTNADTIQNTSVFNNIVFMPNNSNPGSAGMRFTRGHLFYGTSIDNNCVLLPQTSRSYEWSANAGVVVFSTAAAFAANTIDCSGADPRCVSTPGYEGNGINADPSFAFGQPAPDASNYTLQSGSPAIDAGVAVIGRATDFLGESVPSGAAPDIGAFEFGAGRVTYCFSGTATIIDAQNFIGGSASDVPFEGTFSFDPNALQIGGGNPIPGTTTAQYRMSPPLPPNEMFVTLRGIVIRADPTENLDMTMQDGTPGFTNPTDSFHLISNVPRADGVTIDPHPVSSFDLVFLDSSGVVFANTNIPTSFDLADFNLHEYRIQFRDLNSPGTILWEVIGYLDQLAIDQDPPVVTITTPRDGDIVGNTSVAVSADISDDSATTVTSVPAGINAALPAGGGTVNGTVALVEGANSVTVSATDDAGSTGGMSITVIRDTIDPAVTILSPAEGSILGGSPAMLSIDVGDATSTTVTFGGNSVPLGAGGGIATGDVALAEGGNAISVDATDAAGNVTTTLLNVVLDLSAPLVTITSPSNNACFGPGQSSVAVTATVDDVSPTSVASTPSGVTASLPAGGGTAAGVVGIVEGFNTITVEATESTFGRSGGHSIIVQLDTTAPQVEVDSPADGSAVRGTIDFDATALDVVPGSGIARVDLLVDGGLHATFTAEPFESTLDTTLLAEGAHTLSAVAQDAKGNVSGNAAITVTVDNTAPNVSITDPVAGAIIGGTVPLAVSVSDSGSGLAAVEMLSGGTAPTSDASITYATPVASDIRSGSDDTTRFADGSHEFRAVATDAAGNESNAVTVVALDNTAPTKTIVTPLDGQVIAGVINITADAQDPNLAAIDILVDGVLKGSSPASPFTVVFDTATVIDGMRTIRVDAIDFVGNVSSCAIAVEVDNVAVEIHPATLNLKSKGGNRSVTAILDGDATSLALLMPTEEHQIELCVPSGNSVPVTAGFAGDDVIGDDNNNGIPDLVIKFDRTALIASIRAGITAGGIQPDSNVTLTLKADGSVIGAANISVKGS